MDLLSMDRPMPPAPHPILTDDLMRHGKHHPDQCAIDFGQSRCTYGELLLGIQQVASVVRSPMAISPMPPTGVTNHTLHHQPCIALLLPNSIEFLEVFLGTTWAGGIAMVLNPDGPVAKTRSLLTQHPPDLLIADATQLTQINWDTLQNHCPETKAIALKSREHQKSPLPPLPPSPSPLFYLGFTSGTTGHPKGILRSHASWVSSFQAGRVEFGWDDDEHVLVPGAFVHSLSLYSAIETLANGATLHSLTRFTPKASLQRCLDAPITRLVAVPTILRAIARTASRSAITLSGVRTVISGGSKLSPSLRAQLHATFPNARILEYYGASELSFITLASSEEPVPPHSVGRPFQGVDLSVRRDDGTAADPGEIGWIGIRSPMICSGYLDSPDTPQRQFSQSAPAKDAPRTGFRIEHGWATVGDRGWMDDDGYLYLVGREGDMLICNGINIYPAEIEAVLLTHPAIEDAVVLGLPDHCQGDRLCALIKPHSPTHSLTRQSLLTHLHAHLEAAKCPRQFYKIDQFPMNSSGKIDRFTLKQSLLAHQHKVLQSYP